MKKKRNRGKHWDGYDMENASLPKAFHKLASKAKLSGAAYNVYIYLFHNHDMASGRINTQDYDTIAKHCHLSVRHVYRAIGELKEKGFYKPSHRETTLEGRLSPRKQRKKKPKSDT